MTKTLMAGLVILTGCARTDFYYPGGGKTFISPDGKVNRPHNRALVLNGSDSLGATHVRITSNSLEFSNQGGIDNSTSTKEGYRTVRHGITAGALAAVGVAGINAASSSYNANQASVATSNAAASKASAAAAASKSAETVRLAEIAAAEAAAAKVIPAAGSTIPAVIPAVVTPVP
jgi:hypothetical protein